LLGTTGNGEVSFNATESAYVKAPAGAAMSVFAEGSGNGIVLQFICTISGVDIQFE
jgi:stringent starvation protein B